MACHSNIRNLSLVGGHAGGGQSPVHLRLSASNPTNPAPNTTIEVLTLTLGQYGVLGGFCASFQGVPEVDVPATSCGTSFLCPIPRAGHHFFAPLLKLCRGDEEAAGEHKHIHRQQSSSPSSTTWQDDGRGVAMQGGFAPASRVP